MSKIEDIQKRIAELEGALFKARNELDDEKSKGENNVFGTLEEAIEQIKEDLHEQAAEDCEGSHNCGMESYEREFIVGDERYVGTLTVEYNRHDKTYYYVDEVKFSYKTAAQYAADAAAMRSAAAIKAVPASPVK